ncbi:hypothetical protein Taro_011301 [Colocasia esculenta]|uniref:Uncharacterized protein n=1 Tax=Colocasia esculenta TaxID=4460 RepID=A0A843U156_COLES|nr:hypothetical protein [Colocasia esculenta]
MGRSWWGRFLGVFALIRSVSRSVSRLWLPELSLSSGPCTRTSMTTFRLSLRHRWPSLDLHRLRLSVVDSVLWPFVVAVKSVALASMLCFFFLFCLEVAEVDGDDGAAAEGVAHDAGPATVSVALSQEARGCRRGRRGRLSGTAAPSTRARAALSRRRRWRSQRRSMVPSQGSRWRSHRGWGRRSRDLLFGSEQKKVS